MPNRVINHKKRTLMIHRQYRSFSVKNRLNKNKKLNVKKRLNNRRKQTSFKLIRKRFKLLIYQ